MTASTMLPSLDDRYHTPVPLARAGYAAREPRLLGGIWLWGARFGTSVGRSGRNLLPGESHAYSIRDFPATSWLEGRRARGEPLGPVRVGSGRRSPRCRRVQRPAAGLRWNTRRAAWCPWTTCIEPTPRPLTWHATGQQPRPSTPHTREEPRSLCPSIRCVPGRKLADSRRGRRPVGRHRCRCCRVRQCEPMDRAAAPPAGPRRTERGNGQPPDSRHRRLHPGGGPLRCRRVPTGHGLRDVARPDAAPDGAGQPRDRRPGRARVRHRRHR